MKKKLVLLLSAMIILSIIGAIIIQITSPTSGDGMIKEDSKLQVVATFYPIYMIGLNIADQVEDIEVNSLTKLNTGCLHDYQLTTEDMKLISEADVLIINGGGMEGFLTDVRTNYPQLTIIDATEGITMLPSEAGEEHVTEEEDGADSQETSEEHSEHDHGEYNPHVWLDPKLYVQQIGNVRKGLLEYLEKTEGNKESNLMQRIDENAQAYIQKVVELDNQIEQLDKKMSKEQNQVLNVQQAVIFHDSFSYLANRVGLTVTFTVPLDSDTALSAGDIAEIIDEVKKNNIKYLFTEEQYSDSIAKQIEAETQAKVYIIDSAVTGDGSKDSYIKAMSNNIEMLKEALQ